MFIVMRTGKVLMMLCCYRNRTRKTHKLPNSPSDPSDYGMSVCRIAPHGVVPSRDVRLQYIFICMHAYVYTYIYIYIYIYIHVYYIRHIYIYIFTRWATQRWPRAPTRPHTYIARNANNDLELLLFQRPERRCRHKGRA